MDDNYAGISSYDVIEEKPLPWATAPATTYRIILPPVIPAKNIPPGYNNAQPLPWCFDNIATQFARVVSCQIIIFYL